MSQNGPKTISLVTSLIKNPQPPTKKCFSSADLKTLDAFEPLNSSLA